MKSLSTTAATRNSLGGKVGAMGNGDKGGLPTAGRTLLINMNAACMCGYFVTECAAVYVYLLFVC